MVIAMGGCAVRPRLRRPAEIISQPVALAAVVVAEHRRPPGASLRAAEAAEAEVARPARVVDQAVVAVAAVVVV